MSCDASNCDLTQLQLFLGESPQAIEWVHEVAQERHLKEDEVLLESGHENRSLFFVLAGSLRIELAAEHRAFVTHVNVGECVGELSVLDGKPTTARVVAAEASHIMVLQREDLWHLINTSHVVARNLLYMLSHRIRKDDAALSDSFILQQRYARSARIDTLTGLYNRYWLDEMLPRLIERAQTDVDGLGLLMLDVDHFKRFNDSFGHLAGDELLRILGTILLSHLRVDDSAVRFGGEEFVVILPGLGPDKVIEVAERLCAAIRIETAERLAHKDLPGVTASIGVAMLTAEKSGRELIAEADRALYQAKHAGKDQVIVAGTGELGSNTPS
jgi:diguanylate cyclase (GGDEF)-like protein